MADSVANICKAMQQSGIELELMSQNNILHVAATATNYQSQCEDTFTKLASKGTKLWAVDFIYAAAEHSKKNKYQLVFTEQKSLGQDFYFSIGTKVYIPLARGAFANKEKMLKVLDHESGHVFDNQVLLKRAFPKHAHLFGTANKLQSSDASLVVNDHLTLIYANLSAVDKEKFKEKIARFFGHVGNTDPFILTMFLEILRYGEETKKPDFVKSNFEDIKVFYVKDGSKASYMTRALVKAYLVTAGLWEEFKKHANYREANAKDLVDSDVDFLVMCIRSCQKLFN